MKKSIAEKEIEESSWQESFDEGIEICDNVISKNKWRANIFLFGALLLLLTVGASILEVLSYSKSSSKPNAADAIEIMKSANADSVKSYFNLFTDKSPETIIISLVLLLISLVGIMLALYRFHIGEANKYEHFKIGLIRTRIALVFASDENLPIASLVDNVFNYSDRNMSGKSKFQSPIPGSFASDSLSVVVNKIDVLIDVLRNSKLAK
ncbi:hypothetical protein EHO59_10955 [Leptospira semungkisensis]|uniref:Uncharacterized protein n=1 Tax=Leptospira semungkisensis TaxID=2484985 RepID=A0A4R9G0J9_9LEPT|nr:hypothetical protein [Leptospira semungkisensis]TGK04027.1 hypothetical protein EHO59_10955 [Leptospira semungkisensis]